MQHIPAHYHKVCVFYLWHYTAGICFQLGNIFHAAPNGAAQQRDADTTCMCFRTHHRLSQAPASDTMEPYGILIPTSGQGNHINHAAGPRPASWRESTASAAAAHLWLEISSKSAAFWFKQLFIKELKYHQRLWRVLIMHHHWFALFAECTVVHCTHI